VGVARDISERMQVEEELRTENLLKSRLAIMVSDGLKMSLATFRRIIYDAMTGTMGEISPKLRETLKLADRNADRAIRIIGDFHDTSKIEANKTELEQAELDLRAAVSEITEALSPLASERDVN